MSVQVKICGVRTLEDALAAVESGADMLGFNFYPPSPRYIRPEACAVIVRALRRHASRTVLAGVFVNASAEEILDIIRVTGVDYAQLSGDEDQKTFARIQHLAFKAIRPQTLAEARRLAARFANPARKPALLLDAYHPTRYGGTGQKTDNNIAREIAAIYPILLAGGLTPENVAAAVDQVKPWGVDVASGVESAPGTKDPAKVVQFIRRAKAAGGHRLNME